MIAMCLCAVVVWRRRDVASNDDCASAVRDERRTAVEACQLEYDRTKDPKTGVQLAKALSRAERNDDAKRVAAALVDTPARSDALYILGRIARDEDRNDDAVTALREARALHRAEQRPKELSTDDVVLAMARLDRNEFAEALQLIDECITEAQVANDADLQSYCHLAAAKALIRVGYWSAAEAEIAHARPLAISGTRRSDLEYQDGSAAQELGNHALAIVRFGKALQYRKQVANSATSLWVINTELNLAYSLAEQQKFDEARQHLDNARLLDVDNKRERQRTWVAARIAYRQHDLGSAASLAAKCFDSLDAEDLDVRLDVAALAARIALEQNDLEGAERWARRGVEQAERIRGMQSVLELRPWVLAKRRAPYELLFVALARRQQIQDAALIVDAWQARTVQDALATMRPPASLDYRGVADRVTRLGKWLGVASHAAFAKSPDPGAVLHAMQSIDLLALIVANDEVWSLVVNHGSPRLSRIKPLSELQGLLGEFLRRPTDIKPASELGALLLPERLFRATPEVLHVLVDSQLQGLPVAALRHDGVPLIAMRPIVRVLRLPENRCARVTRSARATVLAAADATIPNALTEGERVAKLLHTSSQAGASATKAALFAASNDTVLHVAAHGKIGMDGAALVLADGEVSALEIQVNRLAPSLVVLTACDAAAANDPELAGSLAAGFLGAGSQYVVATPRTISDTGALEISTRFYRAGGDADPVRALATVQSELARTNNTDWPNVAVFGLDVCTQDSPDHR
jgi:tetratricopeptide (TPR) repeat protein